MIFWGVCFAPVIFFGLGAWWELRQMRKTQQGIRKALNKLNQKAELLDD